MHPSEAWLYAASWGSYIRSGDPGACMYGFNEKCLPQSEDHRQAVIHHCTNVCIPIIQKNPGNFDPDEMLQMEAFLTYIKNAPIERVGS